MLIHLYLLYTVSSCVSLPRHYKWFSLRKITSELDYFCAKQASQNFTKFFLQSDRSPTVEVSAEDHEIVFAICTFITHLLLLGVACLLRLLIQVQDAFADVKTTQTVCFQRCETQWYFANRLYKQSLMICLSHCSTEITQQFSLAFPDLWWHTYSGAIGLQVNLAFLICFTNTGGWDEPLLPAVSVWFLTSYDRDFQKGP